MVIADTQVEVKIVMILKIYRLCALPIFSCLLLVALMPLSVLADGGAPNLAYVAGADRGIAVIDVAQQKVTTTISASGDPHGIFLSNDGRFLYVTQPQMGKVAIIAAKTGEMVCSADVPGQPSLVTFDATSNLLYAAGSGTAGITVIDPTNCALKRTFQTDGPVSGMAVANIGSASPNGGGNQLWVATANGLTILDDVNGKKLGSVNIPGDPQYVSIPPGATVYVTTHQGQVIAIGLSGHNIVPLIKGGVYGPMDYDQTTGEVYVPDQQNNRLTVLAPVNAGFPPPPEPSRTINLGVKPESVAITSDGQLGFVALASGNVAMLDLPGRQLITTISVGGSPHFIITGLYPPAIGTTPQQANILGIVVNIAAYLFIIALIVVPILLFRRYAKTHSKT